MDNFPEITSISHRWGGDLCITRTYFLFLSHERYARVCVIDPFRPQIEITAVNCVGGKKIEMVFDEGKNRMAAW